MWAPAVSWTTLPTAGNPLWALQSEWQDMDFMGTRKNRCIWGPFQTFFFLFMRHFDCFVLIFQTVLDFIRWHTAVCVGERSLSASDSGLASDLHCHSVTPLLCLSLSFVLFLSFHPSTPSVTQPVVFEKLFNDSFFHLFTCVRLHMCVCVFACITCSVSGPVCRNRFLKNCQNQSQMNAGSHG